MAGCAICLRDKKPKFKTSRLTICTRCVTLLNETTLSAREAVERLRVDLLANVIHRHGPSDGAEGWVARRFPGILDAWCQDPGRMGVPIKVVRAYRRKLVCLDRRYLDYPADWRMLSYRHRHRDKYTCNLCRKRDETCRVLQSHHIVFRSRSGTNYAANIVVLCLNCHQKQHPCHPISDLGGEPRGSDVDPSGAMDEGEGDGEVQPPPAPPSLWIPEHPTMTPLRTPEVPTAQAIESPSPAVMQSTQAPVAPAYLSSPPLTPPVEAPVGDNAAVFWVLVILGLIVFLVLI